MPDARCHVNAVETSIPLGSCPAPSTSKCDSGPPDRDETQGICASPFHDKVESAPHSEDYELVVTGELGVAHRSGGYATDQDALPSRPAEGRAAVVNRAQVRRDVDRKC
jgi:hypothetical protein